MGVDVLLYAETTPTTQELEAARDLFRRSAISDDYSHNGEVKWQCLEFEDETEWSRPRVAANVTCRFWGEGYERGDWPSIYGAIRLLQSAFPSARVFYGGDYDDTGIEVTEEYLAELWAHFVGPNGNDYQSEAEVTHLASWPPSNAGPAGCEAFDTEHAAETFARNLTAKGHPKVVVYEVLLPEEQAS